MSDGLQEFEESLDDLHKMCAKPQKDSAWVQKPTGSLNANALGTTTQTVHNYSNAVFTQISYVYLEYDSTPPPRKKTYVEEIEDYLNVLLYETARDTEKYGYPPPQPPAGRKRDIFNPDDFLDIDRQAREAPEKLALSYEDLMSHLTKGLTTDLQKLRALFVWTGNQNLVDDSAYSSDHRSTTPYWFLKLLAKSKCGHAIFFALLCRLAGLPCVILKGADKQAGSYSVGQRELPTSTCSWNAVYVDGSWRIVDPQGAFTGSIATSSDLVLIEDRGVAVRRRISEAGAGQAFQWIEEFYFLPDPDIFVYLSRPQDEEAWQLLAEPWSVQQFLDKPLVTHSYLTSEWKLSDKVQSVVSAPGGRCCISFDQAPEGEGTIGYKLFFNKKLSKASLPAKLQLEKYVLITATTKTQDIFTRLPVAGVYILDIEDKNNRKLCKMRIDVTGKIEKKPFPNIPEAGLGFKQEAIDAGFVDPSRKDGMVVAHEGERVCLHFRTLRPLQVRARLVHSKLPSEELSERVTKEEEKDRVAVTVRVPYEDHNPEFSLQIDAREKGVDTDYINVLNYLLTPDRNLVFSKDKEQQITDELRAAMEDDGDDLHRLESALQEYRRAHLGDKNLTNQAYTRLRNLHRQAVCDAESANSLEQLGVAIDTAHNSQVAYFLRRSDWLPRAEATHRRLSRLASVTRKVQKLSSGQVSEVQTYNHPHALVRDAIIATYVLLGENKRKLKNWKYVQSLLRTRGPASILERIKTQNSSAIDKGRVDQAASLLSKCTSPEIRAISTGTAAFYEWSKAVVEERSKEVSDNASSPAQAQSSEEVTDDDKVGKSNGENGNVGVQETKENTSDDSSEDGCEEEEDENKDNNKNEKGLNSDDLNQFVGEQGW